jgi:hypothetical protein
MLLIIFVELRVVAGRSRTRAGSPQAVSRRPCCAAALRRTAWPEHGKRESDTGALCNSPGNATYKTLRCTAWQGNGMGTAYYV